MATFLKKFKNIMKRLDESVNIEFKNVHLKLVTATSIKSKCTLFFNINLSQQIAFNITNDAVLFWLMILKSSFMHV